MISEELKKLFAYYAEKAQLWNRSKGAPEDGYACADGMIWKTIPKEWWHLVRKMIGNQGHQARLIPRPLQSRPKHTLERRSEPRFEAQKTTIVTLLRENGVKLPAVVIEMSGSGVRLLLDRAIAVDSPVKVEHKDFLLLGEVCYCEPGANGFFLGLKIQQVLSNLNDLEKLNRRLMGERPSVGTQDANFPKVWRSLRL
jgi:PilZ domain